MVFSETHGFKSAKNIIQKDSIDDDLRIRLWNLLELYYWRKINQQIKTSSFYHLIMDTLLIPLWHNYFKSPLDSISEYWQNNLITIRAYFMGCNWYEVYDFVEFISNLSQHFDNNNFKISCNKVLEKELSAYRFVGDKIAPITAEEEIAVIDEALNFTNALKPVNIHLRTALDKLANKNTPDYRNSIKESISAVEAICQLITKKPKVTLGNCIKQIEDAANIHPALK
jgi:hypothetical protein